MEPSLVEANAQAAEVCFDRHHGSPLTLLVHVDDAKPRAFTLSWHAVSDRQGRSHANALNATEDGAYAVAIAIIRETHNVHAYSRADHLTGSDYYAVAPGATDLEDALRLEVSGIDRGDLTAVNRRVREKVDQLLGGVSNLPGIACVVGFECAAIRLKVAISA